MIIAPYAATSSSIIANTAAGRLTTVSAGSALAGQDVNRTLFYCSAGCCAQLFGLAASLPTTNIRACCASRRSALIERDEITDRFIC
jgi:hypothetical protein